MSTRSRIGKVNADGTITSIYCHWDGYSGGVGATLVKCYNSNERVDALLALGDLSVLNPSIGSKVDFNDSVAAKTQCIAYGRDRGEENVGAKVSFPLEFKQMAENYNYLWENGQWTRSTY